MAWIDLTDVNIATDDEAALQAVIDAACAHLENLPEYNVVDYVAATEHTEWHGGGQKLIILSHFPVASVTSVTEYQGTASQVIAAEPWDGGSFTSNGYAVDSTRGYLYRTSGGSAAKWYGRVKVVYTVGSAEVPDDLREAAVLAVGHLWDLRGDESRQPDRVQRQLGDYSEQFQWGNAQGEIDRLLSPYRRGPVVA